MTNFLTSCGRDLYQRWLQFRVQMHPSEPNDYVEDVCNRTVLCGDLFVTWPSSASHMLLDKGSQPRLGSSPGPRWDWCVLTGLRIELGMAGTFSTKQSQITQEAEPVLPSRQHTRQNFTL